MLEKLLETLEKAIGKEGEVLVAHYRIKLVPNEKYPLSLRELQLMS